MKSTLCIHRTRELFTGVFIRFAGGEQLYAMTFSKNRAGHGGWPDPVSFLPA